MTTIYPLDGDVLVAFTVPGKPIPKKRPRVTRNGVYTPHETTAFEQSVTVAATQAMRGKQLLDQDVALVAMFERTDRIRCDIDNLVKAVTDAIQSTRASKSHMGRIGPVLRDDSQIVDMRVRLVRGASTDGTTVAILATEGDPS